MDSFIALLILYTSCLCYAATDTITQDKFLRDGDRIVSNGGNFALGFFSPGNSQKRYIGIWFNKVSVQTVVWVANRDNPINNSSSGVVKIDHNGNLAIFDGNSSNPVWSTNISIPITEKTNSSTMFYKLLDSGNLVLFDGNKGDFLWQSFHYPTNTHLPGMKLGLSLKSGLNWSLTSWKSPDDPSTGEFSYSLIRMEAPEMVLKKASQKVWRTGPWNGQAWNGVPDMSRNYLFNYSFVNNQDEIYFIFSMYNASIINFIVLNDQGIINGPTWVEGDHRWSNLRDYPGDRCENYGKCGAFGSCNSNNAEICSCLPGYEPRSPRDWYIADRSKGCARKRELLCGQGDGFLKLEKRKLPDTSNARVYMSLGIEDCEVECRKNCSCTGYASPYVDGSGCLAWFGDLIDIAEFTVGGQDLFVRVDAIELKNSMKDSKGSSSTKNKKVVILCVLIVVGLIILVTAFYYLFKEAKRRGLLQEKLQEQPLINLPTSRTNDETNAKFELPIFDLNTMTLATENFSPDNKLGAGGFGSVYKGKLIDGREIAVKSGYMSPEYAMDGLFSVKSDVFSFGVLLLEVISGKKNSGFYYEDPTMNLIKHAWELWKDGRILELVDPSMGNSFPEQEAVRFIQVGILCVQENAKDRPTMSNAISLLGKETPIPSLKQPAFVLISNHNSANASASSHSHNEMSITVIEGR
ncbi:hypothetical protein Scep_028619 [Stephania cephalantha]|uniref:non-specific serine/threonine protein kinase n=1 Tax=Stephania cephalantha TaxID=152367 RepID=A0AAP0EEV6_9MAGN